MKKDNLTEVQLAQLRALADQPDTHDIPPTSPDSWATARRFHRPRKEAISIRLDADVLDWLRRRSERYQTEINQILRDKMSEETAV